MNRRSFLYGAAASIWTVRTAAQDPQDPEPTRTREVESVDISRDGRLVAAGFKENRLTVWDRATGEQLWYFDCDHTGMPSVQFSPDGRLLACCTSSPDDPSRFIVADSGNGRRRPMPKDMDVNYPQICWTARGDRVLSLGWSPGDRSDDEGVKWKIVSVRPGTTVYRTEAVFTGDYNHAHFAATARDVTYADGEDIVRWSYADKREMSRVHHEATSNGFCSAVSADGRLYASAGDIDGRKLGVAEVFETGTGKRIAHLTAEGHWIRAAAFSPDSRRIATGAGNRSIRVWEIDTGRLIWAKQSHTNTVRAICFSPDGRLLVSGSGGYGNPGDKRPPEGEVIVWDSATGRLLNTFRDLAPDRPNPDDEPPLA